MPKDNLWKWHEGYILALVPMMGLYCVNRYEAGRFAFLGVPTELIDLPASRLISGGTAIVVLGIVLFACLRSARKLFLADSGWKRFAGSFLIFFVLIALPVLMLSTTFSPVAWGLLMTTSFAMASMDTPKATGGGSNESGGSGDTNRPEPSTFGSFVFMSLFLTALIYSYGFFSERTSTHRLCIEGRSDGFVAGFYGDQAIVKRFDVKTGRLAPGVEFVAVEAKLALHSCNLNIHGMPSILDRRQSKRNNPSG